MLCDYASVNLRLFSAAFAFLCGGETQTKTTAGVVSPPYKSPIFPENELLLVAHYQRSQ